MKRIGYILAALMLLAAVSCQREILYPQYPGVPAELVHELGLDEPEMPVRLGFYLQEDETGEPATRNSLVGGTEDPTEFIKDMYMVCFTKEGIYLGWRKADLTGDEQLYTHNPPGFTCQGRELFEGTVPSRTARIHFVGNVGIGVAEGFAPPNIPGNDQVGGNENTLVKSARMSVGLSNTNICYWGFHGEPSSEDMKAWLAVAQPQPDGSVIYGKKDGSNIHMIRDRARVEFGYMLDFPRTSEQVEDGKTITVNGSSYTISGGKITIDGRDFEIDKNPTDYTIQEIYWILSNGLDKGYLAPYYDENPNDHFTGYFDLSVNPPLKEDRLTPYDKADAARYTATEADMVKVYDGTNSISNPLFLFEDENEPANPPKIILKVVYNVDGHGSKTKYHTLMMLNEEQEPCKIHRNHNYTLDIFGLPWEGLGYATFEDAVNSVTYSNNQTVTISESVPAVNDGRFQLSIVGDTNLIFHDPTLVNTSHTITFRYTAMVGSESTSAITADDFAAGWTDEVRSSFARNTVTVSEVSNDGTTFTGHITFTLGTTINAALQGGQIELHDKTTGLSRFINVYTITQFNFLPQGSSSLQLVKTSSTRQVNGVSCDTYKMDIKIPGNYPLGLYPIKIRMATITLNPFRAERKSVGSSTVEFSDEDVSVYMEGTENGSVLDGETLSGMNFTTATSDRLLWNYHPSDEPWNFWCIYTIVNKPTVEDNGSTVEDTVDKIYTIYFDDIRPLRAAANRPIDLGLFLKIKHFGPAVAISY